jgi:hypothetical protein
MNGMGRMRWLVAVGLGLGAIAPGLIQPRPAAADVVVPVTPNTVVVTDKEITDAIVEKMNQRKMLRTAHILVVSTNGKVTLIGTIRNTFARDEALEAVRSTPGVITYDDMLRLDISSPSGPTNN